MVMWIAADGWVDSLIRAAKAHTGSRLDAEEVAQLVYDRELLPDDGELYSPLVDQGDPAESEATGS